MLQRLGLELPDHSDRLLCVHSLALDAGRVWVGESHPPGVAARYQQRHKEVCAGVHKWKAE